MVQLSGVLCVLRAWRRLGRWGPEWGYLTVSRAACRRFMLVFLGFFGFGGWRTVMFQLSGFCCKVLDAGIFLTLYRIIMTQGVVIT